MKVIDSVKLPGYSQWCSNFVKRVISSSKLQIDGKVVDTVHIVDIDGKRIYLSICGMPFIIRTWNYHACEEDENGDVCAENVEFTLFIDKKHFLPNGIESLNGQPLYSSSLKIRWSNDPKIYEKEVKRYNKLHGSENSNDTSTNLEDASA